MNAPWVSAVRFVELDQRRVSELSLKDETIAQLRSDLAVERKRSEDALARLHMLKLQGASEPAPAPAPRDKPTPDIVKAAISRKCGRNKELRRQMEAQVEADRAAGVSDVEIALRIEQGVTDVVL